MFEEAVDEAVSLYPDLDAAGFEKHLRNDETKDWAAYAASWPHAIDYALSLRRIKAFPRRFPPTSYGLKHDVERLTEAQGARTYVPNGVMIVALIAAGVRIKRRDINAIACVSDGSRYQTRY